MFLGLTALTWAILIFSGLVLLVLASRARVFWEDFGISGALAILMTVGVIGILFGLGVWKEKVDDAAKLAGPLLLVLREVLASYFQKRREDGVLRHEKEMADITKPQVDKLPGG